ncbi:MAG: diguanylate cyclase [Hydrogenovibrio crunogenus]|uniref:Diguanylate cyclase (GGDEF domain) with PAS/PAC sensor n=1 Tax=Hydrogenovibrio crunogenus (strain DSM 25203 / XCL-2) TaxID=317025 RepID=Q31JI7_HYDCU|nr:diguanylate cyclase [Hydrogenovibrio crunogenus]
MTDNMRVRNLHQKILNLINNSETIVFYCEYAPRWPVLFLSENFNAFGYTPEQFYAQEISYQDLIHPNDLAGLEQAVAEQAESGAPYLSKRVRLRKSDQTYAWIDIRLTFERDDTDHVTHLLGKIMDITKTISSEEQASLFAKVIQQTADFVKITDKAGYLVFVNQALMDKTGYTEQELIGKTPAVLKSEMQDQEKAKSLWDTILSGEVYHNRIMNRCKDGSTYYEETTISPIFNRDGDIEYFVSTGKDVSEQVKMQQELNDLAMKDALTGIWNRRHLTDVVNTEMKRVNRYGGRFGMIMFDVDYFKQINDDFGHDIGDETLVQIAKIVQKIVRETDYIGRWGGEEFLLIALELDASLTAKLAEKIREAIEEFVFPKVGQVTVSLGATVYHKNETEAQLFKRADEALYLAKRHGRNRVEVY